MALLTAADFRSSTKIWPDIELAGGTATAVTDATITSAVTAATRIVNKYCRDDFEGDTTTAGTIIMDGSGERSLVLTQRIQNGSVTSVAERDADGNYTTIDSTDYRVYTSLDSAGTDPYADAVDVIEYIAEDSTWTEGVLNVRVVAKFGWNTAPWEVKRAVALIVYDMLSGKNAGMHRASEWQTPNMSFNRAEDAFMGIPEVRDLLEQYRQFTVAVI